MFAAAFSWLAGILLFAQDSLPNSAADNEIPVYVTATGNRYHRANCRTLRDSKIEVTLADALASGYTPCGICHPPERSLQAGGQTSAAPLYRVNLAEPTACESVDFSRLLAAEVVDHIDGDTIRVRIHNPPALLRSVETIRLLGVDTPEIDRPQNEAEALSGGAASDFTKEQLLGKTVYLAFDWDLRDRYGRLLAYVYTQGSLCHNAELIRQGYSPAYTRYAFRFQNEFRELEQEAKSKKRGLWQ